MQKIIHVRRHLAAREPIFVGKKIIVLGTEDEALVGNGLHPDDVAHLQHEEYLKAEMIGWGLPPPEEGPILVAASPLARAQETVRHVFVGMAKAYAALRWDIDSTNILALGKEKLAQEGLHRRATFETLRELDEPRYQNSKGVPDDGNELVASAYHPSNTQYKGYRYIVQKAFEGDRRVLATPQDIAYDGLNALLGASADFSTIIAATHQPNIEIMTAALTGNLGKDANELFERAGGEYPLGAGFELRLKIDDNFQVNDASLRRTGPSPSFECTVSIPCKVEVVAEYFRRYVTERRCK